MYEDRHLPMLEWWLSDRLYILKDKPTVFGNPDYQMNEKSNPPAMLGRME